MNEIDILARLRRKVKLVKGGGLLRGIGDDCAVFRPRGSSEDLVFTTDMLVEGVHFKQSTHSPQAIGHKTLARGLSDIAAMGAVPRFCLLSMALPRWAGDQWIESFYSSFLRLAKKHSTILAGGDLSKSERLTCDIVVCGAVPAGTALMRDGAWPGDEIYVSGRLGGSALGLAAGKGPAWKRHLMPEPRVALGWYLREELHATSAMDLSDGISLDLHRLCMESRVSADIDRPIQKYPGATPVQALHGGEDYELLFTVRPETPVAPRFEKIPLTRIGAIKKGRPGRVRYLGQPLEPLGYDHFRRRRP